jgi:PAS domain S-box-containing protein
VNILIADDIAINRKLLSVILEAEGHVTLEASDGVEALQILNREKMDALVSDILMPRMDGYRLCHEVRTNQNLRNLPIVIYTATYTSQSDEKLARDLGADKFVKKPSPVGTILAALHEAITMQHTAPQPDALQQVEVLKEYSDRLVSKLEEKNIELEERLRLTGLSMDVTTALMRGKTLREILQRCSEALVERVDAAFARIWTLREGETALELQASAGLYTNIDGLHCRVPIGQLDIGLIAAERKPRFTSSMSGDPLVSEQEWARREGLVAFAGYPLILEDRLVGVLAMFARRVFSRAVLDKMASIADAIALGIGRKIVEEELDAANDRLHRLLGLSPAVLYNLKVEGQQVVPTFVSQNVERLLGVPFGEANSLEWWLNSLHPEDRDRMLNTLTNGIQDGGYTAEYRIQHRDGTYRWIVDSNRVEYDSDGVPQEIAGVWTDVSEHKREEALNHQLRDEAAAAEAANRAKSKFLSAMSHEIRTPMNAILGYTQLMARDPELGQDAKRNLEIIGRSGRHLLGLINDVLDMSKIEAGRTELKPTTFNLARLVEDLAIMFRLRAEEKALQFVVSVNSEAWAYVVADEGKLRQVLINLSGNAVKFTQRGSIQLYVNLEQRDGQFWLSASVEDTGSGISDEEQTKLFKPFSQTRLGLTAQEGTGLGLAISRGYARLMGGDITVVSRAGSGSTFRFEVPVVLGDAAVGMRRSVIRRVIRLRAGKTNAPRILIADDQLDNRDWLMKLLTSIGFPVREASNGEAAIRVWEEWKPGLILMDVHMPVMDGLEATRQIKACPGGKTTSIVALTASALDDDRRAVSQSGADGFVSKPCDENELLEKIRVLLNVAYEYEEISDTGVAGAEANAISARKLGQLPPELMAEIREATLSGNKRSLDRLIVKVHEADAGSAGALQELADKYEYDALIQVLEEACCR